LVTETSTLEPWDEDDDEATFENPQNKLSIEKEIESPAQSKEILINKKANLQSTSSLANASQSNIKIG
jgi:hypothetical protein